MSEHIRITMNIITIPQSTPVPRNSTVSRPKVKDVVVKVKRRHARTSVLFMGMPYILVISVVPRFGRHIQNPDDPLADGPPSFDGPRHPSSITSSQQPSATINDGIVRCGGRSRRRLTPEFRLYQLRPVDRVRCPYSLFAFSLISTFPRAKFRENPERASSATICPDRTSAINGA